MVFYFILILLFAAVFLFLGWRIITSQQTAKPPMDQFICPHCNESHCSCQKRDNDK